ncbi:MAG: sodium-dependent bicarbonate transport family permease [Pseudomonadota bacterium]
MEMLSEVVGSLIAQLQKPTLAFLVGGMALAAFGSRFSVPDQVYKFIVVVLLLKVGMSAGISMRDAELVDILVPALLAGATGIVIVFLGLVTLARIKGLSHTDAMATVGLFGAVSASTLAAGMAILDEENIAYEGFIGALYPFMDIAALITAIVLARLSAARKAAATNGISPVSATGLSTVGAMHVPQTKTRHLVADIMADTLRSPAISALLLGLALGLLARPETVFESFYEPLFRGFLSILMLIMGMEAWARLSEMRRVAHVYLGYGLTAPLVHGALGFGAGVVAHHLTGFSQGGIVLLAVMAASSSDISGPPTLRGALPNANPATYVGTSTGIGTPVAILSIPLWIVMAGWATGS